MFHTCRSAVGCSLSCNCLSVTLRQICCCCCGCNITLSSYVWLECVSAFDTTTHSSYKTLILGNNCVLYCTVLYWLDALQRKTSRGHRVVRGAQFSGEFSDSAISTPLMGHLYCSVCSSLLALKCTSAEWLTSKQTNTDTNKQIQTQTKEMFQKKQT